MSEQQRCECGQAWFNEPMGVWLQEIARGNMQGQAEGFCAKCGCRLSVVDGEPVVGEKYADLAYAAQANPSNRLAQSMRMLAQDVEIIDALRARVAELEAAVTSIGGAVQNAETALAQLEADEDRDDCRMVLHRARCAVEHERKLAATQDRWDRIGEIRMDCAHYGPALEEASECVRIQTERVAELEAENERLRAALMPLETSSIASAVQEAAAATMQRDQLQAALEAEHSRVTELEAAVAALERENEQLRKRRGNSPLQPHERPGRDWRQS